MMDKIVVRISVLILIIFMLVAIFYERPAVKGKRAVYLPAENFIGRAEAGKPLFQQHCVRCHGGQLEGTDIGPSLLHPYYKPDHHGDITVYLAVYQGVIQHHWQFGNMPAMKHLSAEDAGHLLKFIRQQQRKAGLF